ncbi:MAG: hypothetical protein R3266_09695 [Gemmatimonadota bacterium]|nr:hypothetical protein [Gemmatimonadota bacterium]
MSFVLTIALVSTTVVAADTVVVRPGHPSVDGARLEPYEVVWVQWFETDGRRTLRRTVVDRVRRSSAGDEWIRTQEFLGLDGSPTSRRVNRVNGTTLAPAHERWRFRGRVTHVDYEGRRVSGAMIEEDSGEPALLFDARLPEVAFDFNTTPLLLRALSLNAGMELRFPHARISPPGFPDPELTWATIRVEGRERIEAGPLGTVRARRAVDPEHDMGVWLIDEAPYVVRGEFPIDDSTHSVLELGALVAP